MSFIISLVVLFVMKIRFFPGKSIANIITKRYGRQHLNLFRNCEKTDYKLRKTKLRKMLLFSDSLGESMLEKCIKTLRSIGSQSNWSGRLNENHYIILFRISDQIGNMPLYYICTMFIRIYIYIYRENFD